MPVTLSYPGVYIEELASGVRTITGVATSITAFIGSALRGPTDQAVRIQNFSDYLRKFGDMSAASMMGYAVQQYFQHGGSDAYIVRVASDDAKAAEIPLPSEESGSNLALAGASKGSWGNSLRATVSHTAVSDPADTSLFTLVIEELEAPGSSTVLNTETFMNLTVDPNSPRYVVSVLQDNSALVVVAGSAPPKRPKPTT
ncbi:MAG: phage tail sheath family protein, partial [Burkholderiales bacterium]